MSKLSSVLTLAARLILFGNSEGLKGPSITDGVTYIFLSPQELNEGCKQNDRLLHRKNLK